MSKKRNVSGIVLSKALAQIDPIENYKGTEMENMDSFSRRLKRFDIKVESNLSSAILGFFVRDYCKEDYMIINNLPTISTERRWSVSSVMAACKKNNLYTCGDNQEYERMLSAVYCMQPTHENLYKVACDICKHSDNQTISDVMFILENEAVVTYFIIEKETENE